MFYHQQVSHTSFLSSSECPSISTCVCLPHRSALKCWKLWEVGSWARVIRKQLRCTAPPAKRSTLTAWPSCLLVPKPTAPQSVPTATCWPESMMSSHMKCKEGAGRGEGVNLLPDALVHHSCVSPRLTHTALICWTEHHSTEGDS